MMTRSLDSVHSSKSLAFAVPLMAKRAARASKKTAVVVAPDRTQSVSCRCL